MNQPLAAFTIPALPREFMSDASIRFPVRPVMVHA